MVYLRKERHSHTVTIFAIPADSIFSSTNDRCNPRAVDGSLAQSDRNKWLCSLLSLTGFPWKTVSQKLIFYCNRKELCFHNNWAVFRGQHPWQTDRLKGIWLQISDKYALVEDQFLRLQIKASKSSNENMLMFYFKKKFSQDSSGQNFNSEWHTNY